MLTCIDLRVIEVFVWSSHLHSFAVVHVIQVYYEVHILEHLPADFGDDHQEIDPHVVRVGWSIDSSSFQLGDSSVCGCICWCGCVYVHMYRHNEKNVNCIRDQTLSKFN